MAPKPIKYTKDTRWLRPYMESISHLIDLSKLDAIKGYRVRKGFEENQQGACHKTVATGRCTIVLKTQVYYKADKKYKNWYIANILEVLSHECSHLIHWEHSPSHFALQATIQLAFAGTLKTLGVTDTSVRWEDV